MKRLLSIMTAALACLGFIISAGTGNAQGTDKEAAIKAKCLACHGPYAKLAAKPPFFKGFDAKQSKITAVNPHQYWPHDDKTDKGIQDCTLCHKPHKMGAKAADMEKANVEKCFGCHHDHVFDRCKSCHEN